MSNPMSIFFDFKNVLSLFRIACLMHFSLLIHFFVKLAINVRLDAQLFIVRYLQRYSVVFLILFLYLHYHCSLVLLRIKDLFIIDWFIDRFIDRLIDQLIHWLIAWLIHWLIDLSVTEVKTLTDDSSAYQNYVAMYDFTARNFDELSLKAGEHVLVNTLPSVTVCSLSVLSWFLCIVKFFIGIVFVFNGFGRMTGGTFRAGFSTAN